MTRPALEPLAPFFRSSLQASLLARLIEHEDDWQSIKDLSQLAPSRQVTSLELDRLVGAGIIEQNKSSRPYLYRFSSEAPLSSALKILVERTVGVEQLLRRKLHEVTGVRAAVIFGSWAKKSVTPDSDIDVLVLGDPNLDIDQIYGVANHVSITAARDINPVVFSVEEARRRVSEGSGFLRDVLNSELVPLIGDISHELRTLESQQ